VSVDYVGLDSRRDGRSGLPDLHELQAWGAGVGLIGVTPVPLVVAGLLAVLAVACIVGGAWGGRSSSAVRSPGAASASAIRSRRRLAGSAADGVRDRSEHVRAPGRSPHRRRRSRRTAHSREGGQDQHRRAGPDQAGPGHDRVDRLPGHRGPDQSGCGGFRDPGGPHVSPGTLGRRTDGGTSTTSSPDCGTGWELHAQFRTDLASTRERHRTKVASAGEARHQDRCRRLPFDESAERTLCQSSEYPDGLQHGLCEMCGRHQTRGSAGGGVCLAVGDTVVVAVGEQWIRAAGPHRLDLGCDGNPSQQCNARDVGP
jgi:hypothetical protein